MYAADRFGRGTKDEFGLSWPQALAIGFAQALALMPGTSRSGITMTAGRALGLTRSGSRAVLVPARGSGHRAAGAYEGLKLVTSAAPVDWQPMLVGVVFSALSGIACIHFLIRFIERIGLLPFTIYRLILAGADRLALRLRVRPLRRGESPIASMRAARMRSAMTGPAFAGQHLGREPDGGRRARAARSSAACRVGPGRSSGPRPRASASQASRKRSKRSGGGTRR